MNELKKMRLLTGLSQMDVATMMGVALNTVFLWEKYPEKMTVEKYKRLLDFYKNILDKQKQGEQSKQGENE